MKQLLLLGGFLLVLLSSCAYNNGDDLYPIEEECITDSLTYDGEIKVLINTNCAISGCHGERSVHGDFTTYPLVIANINRIEVRALVEKTMPPAGPLSSCEQDQLNQWITEGAKEN